MSLNQKVCRHGIPEMARRIQRRIADTVDAVERLQGEIARKGSALGDFRPKAEREQDAQDLRVAERDAMFEVADVLDVLSWGLLGHEHYATPRSPKYDPMGRSTVTMTGVLRYADFCNILPCWDEGLALHLSQQPGAMAGKVLVVATGGGVAVVYRPKDGNVHVIIPDPMGVTAELYGHKK